MHNKLFGSTAIKLMIIIFWASVFFGFLYAPKLFDYWKSNKTINVATWTDMLDEEMLKKFEKQTGISINLSYFENNDELLVKIRETKGAGYDLLIPSDHTVQLLIQEGLLQILDKPKITIWDRINPRLLDAYFDPENNYSLPYYWGIYGIGVNKDFFGGEIPEATWDLIFKPLHPFAKVSMLDNPREAILLTALALFGSIDNLNEQKMY
jgi:spermidine/putrescine transport system substrate-binding protein